MECLVVKTYRHLLSTLLSPVAAVVATESSLAVVAQAVCSAEPRQLQVEPIQSL
jgi:hypothetical protein